MSYSSKISFKSTIAGDFVQGSNEWTGTEVQNAFTGLADSVGWESQKTSISSGSNYDCSVGNLQEITLSGNSSLTISNAESGKYYTLIKKGAFTLTLPTTQYSGTGSVTGTGVTVLTFLYDGTNYFFNFGAYVTT